MLVQHFLETTADRTPHAVALIQPSGATSYVELERMANRFANTLRDRGVNRGDRVVLALENCAELVVAYLGTMKAGAVAVPLPAGPRSDRLVRVVRECAPTACLVDAAIAHEVAASGATDNVRAFLTCSPSSRRRINAGGQSRGTDFAAALQDASPERPDSGSIDLDLAAIIYTSGSTGEPRGVMLRHRNIVANTQSIAAYLELTETDRVMCVLPLYYVYGLSLLHTHLLVGGSVVLSNRFAYPNLVLEAMRQYQVTGFAGVPSTFALLLHRSNLAEAEFPTLRYVTQAGGAMPPVRILEWIERGPKVPFFVMYGASEASARLTYLPPADLHRKLGSIGKAIPNTEVVVVRDDGQPAAAGEIGELVARGANISPGYWNDPEETARRFTEVGYRTGDLGYADEDGFLFLVGRRHDMIKVGAHRVGASEIEDVLHNFKGITEAAVVAAPHDILGEVPVAFVTANDASILADADAIRAFCAERLPSHKVPTRIVFLDEMPRTSEVGKTDRVSLRSRAAEVVGGGSPCHQ
jgi:amino acid adenylation domain-containing protein